MRSWRWRFRNVIMCSNLPPGCLLSDIDAEQDFEKLGEAMREIADQKYDIAKADKVINKTHETDQKESPRNLP